MSLKLEDYIASYNDLKNERETTLQKVLEDKNAQIESLSLELKEMHTLHLDMIRDVGRKGDDSIMEEKVKSIYLNDKIKELQDEVLILKAGFEKAEKVKLPLQRELKRQEALIKQFVTWEQLETFEFHSGGES